MIDLETLLLAFAKTLSAAIENRIKHHPITQSKIDPTKLQTDNLKTTYNYLGANIKRLPEKEIL